LRFLNWVRFAKTTDLTKIPVLSAAVGAGVAALSSTGRVLPEQANDRRMSFGIVLCAHENPGRETLGHDPIRLHRIMGLPSCSSMIFSEKRFPVFGIML
jgi:hypothetical protein